MTWFFWSRSRTDVSCVCTSSVFGRVGALDQCTSILEDGQLQAVMKTSMQDIGGAMKCSMIGEPLGKLHELDWLLSDLWLDLHSVPSAQHRA